MHGRVWYVNEEGFRCTFRKGSAKSEAGAILKFMLLFKSTSILATNLLHLQHALLFFAHCLSPTPTHVPTVSCLNINHTAGSDEPHGKLAAHVS